MPSYELSLILKVLPRSEVVSALKRSGELILSNGGIIRQIENLGCRELPYRLLLKGQSFTQGSFFLFHVECAPRIIPELVDNFKRDVDLIRFKMLMKEKLPNFECTLEEEFKPPAQRPSIAKLLEKGHFRENKRQKNPPYPMEEI